MNDRALLREELGAAQVGQDLIRVHRNDGWDVREGYVAGLGEEWLLLAMIDDRARSDGFSAVRLRDVRQVERPRQVELFVRRALQLAGEWPPQKQPPGVSLDQAHDLVSGLAGAFPLMSVFVELEDPSVCFIGQVTADQDETFSLREISTNAEWDSSDPADWSSWRFDEVSRIDAGGGYETALVEVANS